MLNLFGKDKKSKFLFVLVLSTLLITLTTVINRPQNLSTQAKKPVKQQFSYSLNAGWNAIALPVATEGMTARTLCNEISGTVKVARFVYQNWQYYYCSQKPSGFNFDIEFNRGYFVQVTKPIVWMVSGVVRDPNYTLVPGLNFMGVIPTTQDSLHAENLCGPFDGGNLNVTEVSGWKNGGWNTHLCQLPAVNNYQLEKGAAYFLKAVAAGSTPQKMNVPSLKAN